MHLSNFHHFCNVTHSEPNISKSINDLDLKKTSSERQFELLIGNLLKYRILISCSTVFIGKTLYLVCYGAEPADYQFFQGQPSVLDAPKLVFAGILSLNALLPLHVVLVLKFIFSRAWSNLTV